MYTSFGGMPAELALPELSSVTVEVSFTIDAGWTASAWTPSPMVAIGFNNQSGGRGYPGISFHNDGTASGDDDNGNSVTGLPVMLSTVPYIMRVQWDATGIQFQVGSGSWNRCPGPLTNENLLAGGSASGLTAIIAVMTGGGGQVVGTMDYVDINGEGPPGAGSAEFWTDFQAAKEVV